MALPNALASALSSFKGSQPIDANSVLGSDTQTTSVDDSSRVQVNDVDDYNETTDATELGVDDGSDDGDVNGKADLSDEESGEEPESTEEDAGDDTPAEPEKPADEDKPDESDVEEYKIKGTDEVVRVNYTDRPSIKKAYLEAAGMRKFQRERDLARADLVKLNAQIESTTPKVDLADKLSAGWETKGIDGLVEVLTKGQQSFDDLVDARVAHREQLSKMSPAEKAAYDREQEAERKEREAEKKEQEFQSKLKEIDDSKEAAERATYESYMSDSFLKHSFDGKIGDPIREVALNKILWNAVKAELQDLPEEVEITQSVISRVFGEQSKLLAGHIKDEVRKGTKKVLETKKQEAKEQAQSAMKRSSSMSTTERELRDGISKGNFMSSFTRAMKSLKK